MAKITRKRNFDLPELDVYWRGWAKYYHYDNHTDYTKPPSLFQNNKYFSQRIPIDKVKEKDQYGPLHIPSKATFFFVVYNETISVYQTREDSVITQNLVDNLKIDYIEPVPEDKPFNGGIKDGQNWKFGSCLKIFANIPFETAGQEHSKPPTPLTWIICPFTNKEKMQLIQLLVRLKINHQRHKYEGIKITAATMAEKAKEVNAGLGTMIKPKERRQGVIKDLADGYWVKLQDWTECSLQCGNGTSYQQWMCVPPRGNGKPCEGEAIRKKPCNEFKCPQVEKFVGLLEKTAKDDMGKDIAPKPVVRYGRFSNRPQRYQRCIVKENDIFYEDEKNEEADAGRQPIRKPARIIMNNKTISIFREDSYEDLRNVFELDRTNFMTDEEKCCFVLTDHSKKQKICGYKSFCGPEDKNEWAEGWMNDFKMFKTSCKTNRNLIKIPQFITPELERKMNDGIGNVIADMQEQVAHREETELKKEVAKQDKRQYEQKKKEAVNNELTVISKEINLENMVKQEEQTKEEARERDIQFKIEVETKKQECIEAQFSEKEMDDEFEQDKEKTLEEIAETKRDAQRKINNNRMRLRRNILEMKKKGKQKRQEMMGKLTQIRSKMSKEIILANKNGSQGPCTEGYADENKRNSYCDVNYVTEWLSNSECKKKEEFCPMCCENEFGSMYMKSRDRCYDMCDKLMNPKKEKEKEEVKDDSQAAKIRKEMLEALQNSKDKAPIVDSGNGSWQYSEPTSDTAKPTQATK